jgi:hypothetical protein
MYIKGAKKTTAIGGTILKLSASKACDQVIVF